MTTTYQGFEQRKQDHITHALDARNQASGESGLSTIQLTHDALPELNFSDISIASTRFGQTVQTPFLVSSMTAGHDNAKQINQRLAEACAAKGWAMGVGSQRRELDDKDAHLEWQSLRKRSNKLALFGNIGLAQLIETPLDAIKRLVDNLAANAMIIHTNPLQECLQKEGTPNFKGGLKALAELCQYIDCPVILKETGCGFSHATLLRLQEIGLAAVDVSGYGGTHWGRIEGMRQNEQTVKHLAALTFKSWGISTLDSLITARKLNPAYEIWGSGGVRSGLDAAKLLALGASTIGFAKPMLVAALAGMEAIHQQMNQYEYELKTALFCTGAEDIATLQEKHVDLIS